jgi:EAL domain-containing protein (putative c-di-GMP-specific phosphodiesterase class I)
MMPMLDKLVIDKVLSDMQEMTLSPSHRIAVNISVASIENHDFASHLLTRLQHYAISPHWLEIEITEEAILSDNQNLLTTLETLKSHGIKIAMDDFGTGYASFPHLLKYPFDKIKLDRSLLLDASTKKGKDLYQLIVKMGDVADCEVVAEGVETKQEYEFVSNCGVDKVQGFLIAKPQPLSSVLEKLKP